MNEGGEQVSYAAGQNIALLDVRKWSCTSRFKLLARVEGYAGSQEW